jgi:tetratricopeptide (TPR) repeat protein
MQFDQGLELEPNALAGRLASARLAIEEKDYDRAERDLARAIAANPQDGAMRLELARVYELRGKLDAAAATYREYLAQHPAFAAARRRLGIIYREQKKLDQAIVEFELAYQADPMEEDDWNLARAYTESKKADQALPHWTKLKARHPDNFEAAARLGQMALQKRDYALAQAALLDAIRLDPRVPDPYVDLANVMYLQERYPQTIQVLDRMAAMKVAETPWSAFLRAITLDKLGAAEQALASYQKFLPLAAGKFPDQEFQARQRIKALNQVLEKRGRRRRQ